METLQRKASSETTQRLYRLIAPVYDVWSMLTERKALNRVLELAEIKDGENIDKALKRFKRKFDKTGVMRSLRDRKQFVKPSVVHRSKIKKAQYIQKLKDQENL